VVEAYTDEGCILLRRGVFHLFELDSLSATIWRALVQGDEVRSILRDLCEAYPGVECRVIEEELLSFLIELQDHGLLLQEQEGLDNKQ
jgi:hypothetical protein